MELRKGRRSWMDKSIDILDRSRGGKPLRKGMGGGEVIFEAHEKDPG